MPYDVFGWVEYSWEIPEERDRSSSWEAVLSLAPFGLIGDEISRFLFGLAKDLNRVAPFYALGAPADASDIVRAAVEENERFIRKHGEGAYGHTWASWGDIQLALARRDAPELDRDEVGGWPAVIDAVRLLGLRLPFCRLPASQLRLVVWGVW